MWRFGLIAFLVIISCSGRVDEEAIARRLDRNNELLEKQINLLDRNFVLSTARLKNNAARDLFEESENWTQELELELDKYQNTDQIARSFSKTVNRFNDSMKNYSGLLIDWSPDMVYTDDAVLLRSWKRNNLLLLKLAILDKCMELYEVKTRAASESLVPVVYSAQFYQVQKGKNAMFDVAFKSKKPELVEISIQKAMLNNRKINLNNIEIDRYTQRFILFNLEKGNYLIEGELILINERGEKENYPFKQEFYVD
ncbi:MAG: hypothetical protein GC180_10990 [Bacteroidetes bacterium]|nr:hypothetical protein [Bacteroidota bacterium]